MSTVATITMQRSSQYAPDPARERATMSQYNNNDRGEGSSSGAYSNGYSTANTSRASQQQSAVRSPSSAGHAMPGASEATTGKGDQEAPRPLRRPSGIALPTHQALVHDPVYMAARTSPIGPPPRAALPALPPGPPGNRGPPPRNGLPAPPAQQQPHQQQQGDTSGMLAMASESRPLTAVYNGDWSHPPSSMAGQSTSATHGTSSEGPSQVGSTSTSSPTKDRTNRRSTSASRQRRQQTSVDSPTNTSRAAGPSRHARHGTDASTSSSPAGPSSSGAAPQADGSTDRMASKTVLTIALLEAQTAVDLDESDQAEAAIASYSKSVELLQEVMRRVAENAGTYRQKELDRIAEIKNERMTRWKQWRLEQYRRAGLQVNPEEIHATDEEIETREERREREKREARIAKRERMRVEECAKLRVIHDTYAERVRALKDELAARESQTGSQQPADEQASRRTEESDTRQRLSTLSLDSEGGYGDGNASRSTVTPIHSSHASQHSFDKRAESAARAGIGSAMLAESPISPTFVNASITASMSTSPPNRVLSSAVPFPTSSPSSQSNARLSYTSSTSTSPPSLTLPEIHPLSFSPANLLTGKGSAKLPIQDSQAKQISPPAQQSILSFSPDSETSSNTAFSEQQQLPGSKPLRTHRKNASSSASFKRSSAEGYATFGDLAAQQLARQSSPKISSLARQANVDDSAGAEGLATPTPDTAFSKAFAPHPDQEELKSVTSDASRSRAESRASNALRNVTSNESLASTTTSSSSIGRDQWNNAAQQMPLPPVPSIPKGASASPPPISERAVSRASIIGAARPLRSASLVAGQPTPVQSGEDSILRNGAPALASENQRASALLINPSTLHGTISQRRKSPQIPESATFSHNEEGTSNTLGVPQSQYQGMTGLGLTRTTSTERAPDKRASSVGAGASTTETTSASNGRISPQPFNVAGSLPMRLRALSQPSKRPAIPSFNNEFGSGTPPLPGQPASAPSMQRADSDPSNTSATSNDPPPTPTMPSTPMSFDYAGSMDDGAVVDDGSSDQMVSPSGTQQAAMYAKSLTPHATSFLEPGTPASASFQQQYSRPSPNNGRIGGVQQVEYQPPPSDVMRIPFHFMRQIRASIISGAYLTPRLYIPKQLWSQSNIPKLIQTELKVRMIELILNGLESIERTAGDILLIDGQIKPANLKVKIDSLNKLIKELENLDSLLDSIQMTLAKKLPYIEQPNGKKGGGGSFGAWSSKLSRSMDRMTKGKNLDAPETYVAAIARLCLHAQIIDRHLASLHSDTNSSTTSSMGRVNQNYRFGGNSSNNDTSSSNSTSSTTTNNTLLPSNGTNNGYSDIPNDRKVYIEMRLKRISDFFSKVICKILLNDLGIWLDKYSKRAAGWTTD